MKNRSAIIFLVLLIQLSSCIDGSGKKKDIDLETDALRTVSIDGEYSISLPKFMNGTTGLNEEASLQYQSLRHEAYVIVIDEPKERFEEVYRDLGQYDDHLSLVQNYRDARLKILSRTTEIIGKSEPKSIKINGLETESLELDAKVNGLDNEISYFLTFVDGDEKVYLVMCWTLKNLKEEHKKTFKTIAESFKLID